MTTTFDISKRVENGRVRGRKEKREKRKEERGKRKEERGKRKEKRGRDVKKRKQKVERRNGSVREGALNQPHNHDQQTTT